MADSGEIDRILAENYASGGGQGVGATPPEEARSWWSSLGDDMRNRAAKPQSELWRDFGISALMAPLALRAGGHGTSYNHISDYLRMMNEPPPAPPVTLTRPPPAPSAPAPRPRTALEETVARAEETSARRSGRADGGEVDRILSQYGPEPQPLGGPAPLPDVRPREMRTPPLGQSNLVDRALSSFGQPSLDALREGYAGKKTPQEVARTFLETGPMGPFGVARSVLPPAAAAVAERPISAAIRYRGEIFRGTHHADAVAEAVKKYGQRAQDELFESASLHDTNGFVTNTGRYLTRDEAHKLMQQRGYSDHDQSNPLYTRNFDSPTKGAPRVPNPIRAYHGSPHDFDEFRLDRVGTGEGAQAYGQGLYFAEHPAVAGSYRVAGTGRTPAYSRHGDLNEILVRRSGDINKVIDDIKKELSSFEQSRYRGSANHEGWKEYLALAERYRRGDPDLLPLPENAPGRVYEVNLHARPEQFLDWDRPLSGQPAHVRDYVNSNYPLLAAQGRQGFSEMGGDELGRILSRTPDAANAGIPGIRYLDQGSRSGGQGTSNFVVFDPAIIEILRKYGIAGTMGGVTAADVLSQYGSNDGPDP